MVCVLLHMCKILCLCANKKAMPPIAPLLPCPGDDTLQNRKSVFGKVGVNQLTPADQPSHNVSDYDL